MSSFLKGRRLWRYVTGEITKPTKQGNEDETKFYERLEEWDSKNHQILTWIRNTTIPSIKLQFGQFETAQKCGTYYPIGTQLLILPININFLRSFLTETIFWTVY